MNRVGRFASVVRAPRAAIPAVKLVARSRQGAAGSVGLRLIEPMRRGPGLISGSPQANGSPGGGKGPNSRGRGHAPVQDEPEPTEPEPTEPEATCPLSHPGSEVGLMLEGCRTIFSDTASAPDPRDLWGAIECQSADRHRHRHLTSGGDTRPAADGEPSNGSFRRLTVIDGDDFWGERCELGRNDHRHSPTALYEEGMRRATIFSVRLPESFALDVNRWQTIMQMKQAQPSDGGGGVPVLEMQAYDDRFRVTGDEGERWTYPATKGEWIRLAFDVTYSQDPDKGSIQVGIDTTGDSEIDVRSPRIEARTLKTETEGSSQDGLSAGDPIPSHLRMGIYHDSPISCPDGCAIEIDNVQVMAP